MLVSLKRIDTFLAMADAPALCSSAAAAAPKAPSATGTSHAKQELSLLTSSAPNAPSTAPFRSTPQRAGVAPAAMIAEWEGVYWDKHRERQALREVALQVPPGALVRVTGVVGSGKTAFLLALLDELTVVRSARVASNPKATASGATGYFAQTPAILNGTFEDNVTFGMPFDQQRFNDVVWCACLDTDIAIMPAGSKTEIGEVSMCLAPLRFFLDLECHILVTAANHPPIASAWLHSRTGSISQGGKRVEWRTLGCCTIETGARFSSSTISLRRSTSTWVVECLIAV